ncbi:ATP-grasp domain-containing protein [Chloroflexota bacterium]
MKLYEYEGKRIFKGVGIEIPKGLLISSPAQARKFAGELGGPVILKAQVLASGRGKVGGVRLAETPVEAEQTSEEILKMNIKGYDVENLLVEEALDIQKEIYISMTYEEKTKGRLILVSASGGVDINEVAEKTPEKLKRISLGSWMGLQTFQARELAFYLGLSGKQNSALQSILLKLWKVFEFYDASLVEVNPLIITRGGRVVVADSHIEIDNDALLRQKERLAKSEIFDRVDNTRLPTSFEEEAAAIDKSDYRGVAGRVVDFPGNLGLLIGAGGGSLTIFDAILRNGGNPANYCEVGGNPPVSKVYRLCKLILQKPGVKGLAVITNVFSNSRVDFLARGMIKAMLELDIDPQNYPILFRSAGAYEEDAYAILRKYGVKYLGRDTTLDEASKYAVNMLGKK